jgi:hypothetical protein
MKKWVAVLGLSVLMGLPCLAQVAAVETMTEDAVSAEILDAREILDHFYKGELKEVYERFSVGFAAEMSRDQLTVIRKNVSDQLGLESEILNEKMEASEGYKVYVRRARFEKFPEVIEVQINFLADNSIGALVFAQEKK